MSRVDLKTLEKLTVSDLRSHTRSLKRIRHWQKQLWKAQQKNETQRKAS